MELLLAPALHWPAAVEAALRSDLSLCTPGRGSSTGVTGMPFMRLAAPTHGLLHWTWLKRYPRWSRGGGRGEEGEGRREGVGRWLAAVSRRHTRRIRSQARWGAMRRPWQRGKGVGAGGRGQWAVRQADGGWCCRHATRRWRAVGSAGNERVREDSRAPHVCGLTGGSPAQTRFGRSASRVRLIRRVTG